MRNVLVSNMLEHFLRQLAHQHVGYITLARNYETYLHACRHIKAQHAHITPHTHGPQTIETGIIILGSLRRQSPTHETSEAQLLTLGKETRNMLASSLPYNHADPLARTLLILIASTCK